MVTSAGADDRLRAAPHRPGFIPALEGMRALAAIGVLTTHVAFQTRSVDGSVLGAVWGRLDLAVALFFALSGFLLWRPHAAAARGGPAAPGFRRYLRHRVVRIWPAYLVVVVFVLVLLPDARGATPTVWLANLFIAQIYVPLSLTLGMTQMWTLSVEVSFYALLPLIAFAVVRLRGDRARLRIPLLLAAATISLSWGWIADALPLAAGVAPKNWLPGHLPWFVVGMVMAEMAAAPTRGRIATWIAGHRVAMSVVVVLAYAAACTPIAGPTGLAEVSSAQFAVKIVLGAIVGFGLLAPIVLRPAGRFRFLDSAVMQALGRWSYAIFIWHLAVLSAVFSLFGFGVFGGSMWAVWLLTLLITIGVAAASYGLIEEPARRAMRDAERRRSERRQAATDRDAGSAPAATSVSAARAGS
ncbi:Peptidoglycan/LPS O-acetylase OafA/YrhL, contains acyltransferase and SGNH-hydrolase domains [Williamsia maris]|uniref:Peptidoglycan/LPS O-acetylase OafA/YrhL, contains acyltransferase and SGNH-hydrolase domains n=1 Tax=Williamsia maris TaxID=72806 RepID=A0ABT1HDQ8_9NOCA|nr:Peptidoglycan/LPS O-acetylase OafA/YrhL, contains acyltransferase and SGNH-hydrolase domains [Williamsia maris]